MADLTIILASGSPRRTQLLTDAGIKHVVHVADVDESLEPDLLKQPTEACKKLAERKASAAVESYLADPTVAGMFMFIGADTMVVEGGEIFGKPADAADARRMLGRLSGVTHQVMTAVSLWMVSAQPGEDLGLYFRTLVEVSDVTFHPLTAADIDDYLACGESWDKAGAYAIQGQGARLVKSVDGDWDNVVGLPVQRLLRDFPDLFAACGEGQAE